MQEKYQSALKQIMHPLRTVEDDGEFSDLAAFGDMLKGVRVIGLGEGSHGMREHFQAKHRLVRYLVEKKGYRTFAIEASTAACLNINNYILYGKGDKHQALASQTYWVWDTEEVMAMIDWMRDYNLHCEKGHECSFLGFDMKPVKEACRSLKKHLEPICEDEEKRNKSIKILNECEALPWPPNTEISLPDIIWLTGYLYLREVEFVEKTCRQAYNLALHSARLLYQYVDCMRGDTNTMRDFHMAENITLLMNELPEDSKVILWAHNDHMAKKYKWKVMGEILKQRYGSQYFAVGFFTGGGTFQSRLIDRKAGKTGPLTEFDIPVIDGNLWEADLKAVETGNFYFNLREEMNNSEEIRQWANQIKPYLTLDEGYCPDDKREMYEVEAKLGEVFDAILFTERTSRAKPNPTGRRD